MAKEIAPKEALGGIGPETDPYASGPKRIFIFAITWAAVALAAYTLYAFAIATPAPKADLVVVGDKVITKREVESDKIVAERAWRQFLYAAWAIGPPIWFWLEWNFILWKATDKERYAKLQDHSRAIWAALLLVLGILYASTYGLKLD